MSTTFSQYGTGDQSKAGFFRIGYTILQIPPQDILTYKTTNDDEVTPLRSPGAMFIKTGTGRWDLTVRFTVLTREDSFGNPDYSLWEDLQTVLAYTKAAPFVEVENDLIRQTICGDDPTRRSARMAFAIRQLRVDTHPDIVGGLQATLTMTLFNYLPYSMDFAYKGDSGGKSDAIDSAAFKSYIETWKQQNLPGPEIWQALTQGTLTMTWREYVGVPVKGNLAKLSLPTQSGTGTIKINSALDAQIVKEAQSKDIDPALLKAIIQKESGFNPQAVQPNLPSNSTDSSASVAAALKSAILTSADGGTAAVQAHYKKYGKYPDLGLGQINYATAQRLSPGIRPVDLFNSNLNVSLAAKYLGDLMRQGASDQSIWVYNTGIGRLHAPFPPGSKNDSYAYRDSVLALKSKYSVQPAAQQAKEALRPQTTPPPDADTQDFASNVQALTSQGYQFDHATEQSAFFYLEHSIVLTDTNHGDVPSDYPLYPGQISVLFVNRLAQIQLAGYQYPTYQHIGPATSLISIGFQSVGTSYTEDSDPVHEGLQQLSNISYNLEQQFLNFRTAWRSVASVHRMQALQLQNHVLNMLGVTSVMMGKISSETVPDSADMLQVTMLASQYENIFESIGPYKVNGIPKSYSDALNALVSNGSLNSLPAEEKSTIPLLSNFSKDLTAGNEEALKSYLFGVLTSQNSNAMSNLAGLSTVQLSSDDRSFLLGLMQPVGGLVVADNNGNSSGSIRHDWANGMWPALSARVKVLSQGAPLSFADYFALANLQTRLSSTDAAKVNAIKSRIDPQFASTRSDLIKQMYSAVFTDATAINTLFHRDVESIVNSPKFSPMFMGATPAAGPGANTDNDAHGAYRDLGLRSISLDGSDFNPGRYFFDYSAQLREDMRQGLKGAVDSTTNTSQTFNQSTNPAATPIGTSDNPFIPGNGDQLMRTTNIPAYSMAEAFPAFKLFLMEEDNLGPFFCFDNFYSYASVLGIEIIQYQDKPWLAKIQLTNISHLFNHRLFDDTAMGKREAAKSNLFFDMGLSSDGSAVVGPDGVQGKVIGGKVPFTGENYQIATGQNLVEGIGPGRNRVPLRYLPLQTGTKIQIRFGFTNNPDGMTPVFTGEVAEIEGNEILTITAQSYHQELMNTPSDKAQHDGWFKLGDRDLFFLGKGAAYGGLQVFGDRGETDSVLTKMIQNSQCRHFGRFQVAAHPDNLLKGFTWTELVGKVAGALDLTTAAAVLQNVYDRSGENILVNHVIDAAGNSTDVRLKRSYLDENEDPLSFPAYHVADNDPRSLWDLMKDVSRRYPEFDLMVKQYGFPYGAEATLVFGHPLDWYYSRWKLIGDAEREHAAPDNTGTAVFRDWWNQQGQALYSSLRDKIASGFSPATGVAVIPTVAQAGEGPESFEYALDQMQDSSERFFGVLTKGVEFFDSSGLVPKALTVKFARDQINAVRRAWQVALQLASPQADDRLKPIRKYHFIDHQSIIHNGIRVNDNIYNCVRVGSNTYPANKNIPSQHIRLLDVNGLINLPDRNVVGKCEKQYAQSFLKEEVGKMYEGDLVLRGIPDIEPFDCIIMTDPSTATVGAIIVDKVIHNFDQETGYTTIVQPKCFISINEAASAALLRRLSVAYTAAYATLHGFTTQSGLAVPAALAVGTVAAAVVAIGIIAPPTLLLVGLIGLLAAWGASALVNAITDENIILVVPLSRSGRPWLGGLQGYRISDLAYTIAEDWANFVDEEIQPTLEAYRALKEGAGGQ